MSTFAFIKKLLDSQSSVQESVQKFAWPDFSKQINITSEWTQTHNDTYEVDYSWTAKKNAFVYFRANRSSENEYSIVRVLINNSTIQKTIITQYTDPASGFLYTPMIPITAGTTIGIEFSGKSKAPDIISAYAYYAK